MNKELNDIVLTLKKILEEKNYRMEGVEYLHNFMLEDHRTFNDEVNECLLDLSMNLNYYEDDENIRKESTCYYGEERLYEEISEALVVLRKFI